MTGGGTQVDGTQVLLAATVAVVVVVVVVGVVGVVEDGQGAG